MNQLRYAAFISYCRSDERVARRLQRAIETYRPPRELRTDTTLAATRAALRPVFRDKDDLRASGDLQASITEALSGSRALIVLCSPEAARSEWVDREILYFQRNRPDGPVLPIILAGEPNHRPAAGEQSRECFPPALRRDALPRQRDGEAVEPLAADMRPGGDGRRLARLKVIAALLGVDLDRLVQRDAHRRVRMLSALVIAISATMVLLASLTFVAIGARRDAEQRRAASEDLVEFMLGDLRRRLEPVGRLDVLDAVGEKALDYYDSQNQQSLDADSLGRRSRALQLLGEIYDLRGDLDGALSVFRKAERSTAALLDQDPANTSRIFDHAQSIFWLGYVAVQRGDTERAAARMQKYLEMAESLVSAEPANERWQLELLYAQSNLGSLAFQGGDWEQAAAYFTEALGVNERLLAAAPDDPDRVRSVAETASWLASTYAKTMDYDRARRFNDLELSSYDRILERDPQDMVVRERTLTARRTRAEIRLSLGDVAGALESIDQADRETVALLRLEPDSTATLEHQAEIERFRGELWFYQGDRKQARSSLDRCIERAGALAGLDATVEHWRTEILYPCMLYRARLDLAAGAAGDAQRTVAEIRTAAARLNPSDRSASASTRLLIARLDLLEGDILAAGGHPDLAGAKWSAVQGALHRPQSTLGPRGALLAATALIRLDRPDDARAIVSSLRQTGYRHPALQQIHGLLPP